MATIEQSIEVGVSVSTAYNQWTQFEDFPRFMEGVERVNQIDDTRMHWVAQIGGKHKEWDAEITEQQPDQRIAWRATDGTPNAGIVTFQPVSEGRARVVLTMDYEPEGVLEKAGDLLGVAERRVKGDLERFREVVEQQGGATGEWRGEVRDGTSTDI
jgi:uncharacterized membrane protein